MAVSPHDDNSIIWQAKSWDEIKRLASTEQAGSQILAIRKFASLQGVSTTTPDDVWDSGGNLSLLSAAETMDIVSTSANDTFGGTGAGVLLIDGLDNDYNLTQETVLMSGLTPVTTTNSYLRVHRLRVVTSGSTQSNVGVITATASTASTTQGQIPATKSITHQSHFTIPAGYTGFTTQQVLSVYRTSGSGAREAEITQMAFSPAINTLYETLTYGVTNNGGNLITSPPVPSVTPEKTTVFYRALASGNNTAVSTIQEMVLLKGDYNIRTEI